MLRASPRSWCAALAIPLALAACGGEEPRDLQRQFSHDFNEPPSDALTQCTDAGLLLGVDVSKYDAQVNWGEVRDAGVVFAFARISDGLHYPDAYFDSNWSQMKSAGIIRGSYQFFEAAQDPHAQAQLVLSHIPDFGPGDLPPVIDVESLGGVDAGSASASIAAATAAVQAWVSDIHAALNRRPIIYTSARVWAEFNNPPLDADLWVVNWGVSCPAMPPPWVNSGWVFWQYSATGTVSGLNAEPVDMDRFNGSLSQLKAYAQTPIALDGGSDGGAHDGGIDGGAGDAGSDAGESDAGTSDAGESDAGSSDAGPDAGTVDAGSVDGGVDAGVTATLLSPAPGAQLSGIISLKASATGAATLEIFLDDALLATSAASPFTATWDTRQSADGAHHLQAKAFAASGVERDSVYIEVFVQNQAAVTCGAGTFDDGGVCEPICAEGATLDGGVCVAPAPVSSGGCASVNPGWLAMAGAMFHAARRRKRVLRAPRQPC